MTALLIAAAVSFGLLCVVALLIWQADHEDQQFTRRDLRSTSVAADREAGEGPPASAASRVERHRQP